MAAMRDRAPMLLILAITASFPCGVARADETHFQNVPLGERALGFGGAFTGVADDPAAAYYNPAGLAQLPSGAVSASLSVYAFDRQRVVGGYGSPVGTADLSFSLNPTLPIFAGIVKKFGRRGDDDMRRHAFAFSTFIPNQRSYDFNVYVRNAGTMVSDSLHISRSDRAVWVGPSYAYRIDDRYSFGASAFLTSRTMSHREYQTTLSEGMRDPDGLLRSSTLFNRESLAELSTKHLVFRLGLLGRFGKLQLGAMLQLPGIEVSGSSRVLERRAFADLIAVPGYATYFSSDQGDLPASSPIPWEVRVGGMWKPSDDFSAAFDLSVVGPNGSADDLIEAIGQPSPDPITMETPQPGIFVATSFYRSPVVNAAIGFQTTIADEIPLSGGLFTNFSAAPDVTGPTDRFAITDVDLYGASLAVGLRTDDYNLSIGVAGYYGVGDGLRLNPTPGLGPTPQTYLPTTVEERTIYIVLSGYRQAISRLATDVYHEIADD